MEQLLAAHSRSLTKALTLHTRGIAHRSLQMSNPSYGFTTLTHDIILAFAPKGKEFVALKPCLEPAPHVGGNGHIDKAWS
jgi:hypothetical protein